MKTGPNFDDELSKLAPPTKKAKTEIGAIPTSYFSKITSGAVKALSWAKQLVSPLSHQKMTTPDPLVLPAHKEMTIPEPLVFPIEPIKAPVVPMTSIETSETKESDEMEIDSFVFPFSGLSFGPLKKSTGTIRLEEILNKLADTPIDQINIVFREPDTYLLWLPGEKEINLSFLIKNANLSQLTLSDSLISKIGNVLSNITGYVWTNMYTYNPIVDLLPESQKIAIGIYRDSYYRNINRMFRSEPFTKSVSLNKESNKNLLAHFLIGCLVNDAANKVLGLTWDAPEKDLLEKIRIKLKIDIEACLKNTQEFENVLQNALIEGVINFDEYNSLLPCLDKIKYFYPEKTPLVRGEELTEENIQFRTAGPWTFPALTSYSTFKDGVDYFNKKGTTKTKLFLSPGYYVINDDEGEVVLPQGTVAYTKKEPEPGLLSTIVLASPQLEHKNHYWSELALQSAYDNYLNNDYIDMNSFITVDDVKIARPNHGLAHTARVMTAIEQVINYFANHAKEKAFRDFCNELTENDIEWLCVAAAFSVTGRESEASWKEKERYNQFRDSSAAHFVAFVDQTLSRKNKDVLILNEAMKMRLKEVLLHLGNPDYESTSGLKAINKHPDEDEKNRRNFIHRILSIAHNLDLPRCKSAQEFSYQKDEIGYLSEESESQKRALNKMLRYQMDLIKAHGDCLSCEINDNGDIVDVKSDYTKVFAQASTSVKRVFELIHTIPNPIFRSILGLSV